MAFSPLPIIAVAVAATMLLTRKDDINKLIDDVEPDPDPAPDAILPGEQKVPAAVIETREVVAGSVETPFGDLAIEARPVDGGYQLWLWDIQAGEWSSIGEPGGDATVFDTAEEGAESAGELVDLMMEKVEVRIAAEFDLIKDGSNPMTFTPNKVGQVALVRDIDIEGQYRGRLAGGDFKDFVSVSALTLGPNGPVHLVVASLNGSSPADALKVDYTPKGAVDNFRIPLVSM